MIEKTDAVFDRLVEINKACFKGIEIPPVGTLRIEYDYGDLFAYSVQGEIIGYALGVHQNGPFLWSLAVIPQMRKTGVGGKLIDEVCEFYRGQSRIDLTCHIDNPAQKLYFDHGFRALKVLPNYYGRMSGIRMRRPL